MRISSPLNEMSMQSPLQSVSTLNPKSKSGKSQLAAAVMLTSLVDAFSILVIYLLVSSSNSGEVLYLSKDMQLPQAQQAAVLDRNTLIKIEKDRFYLEEKEVSSEEMVQKLIEIRKSLAAKFTEEELETKITIQADKKTHYSLISQVVQASHHAGFEELKFAVLSVQ